ncbi:DISARM system SNF2-like helicase DrmD [Caballeronia sp. LjRoot31]|uniref:DISARM system SNF2-like helicase DrmD n=1 Tax=Caballeronia sp. LjRoot31 TaxID=3342324 RepID=UPI003ECDAF05
MTIVQSLGIPVNGQLVSVRNRRYVVTAVAASGITEGTSAENLVSLSSVEDDAAGEELRVIWELEPGASILERASMPEFSGFDEPERLDAFLNAVRWGAVSQGDTRTLQAPFRSGVEIEDYQLDPLARAIQMPRVNLLIADDVGLGKTIESGLVIQEMLLRHRARTVLIVCPSSIQIQWRDQMRDKFGLEFRIVDSELMKELRRTRGLGVNPWTHFPRLITSMDFLKRERPLRLMREALPAPGQPIYPRRFDMLVVDEAHNVAPSGTGRYATDSQRTAAIRLLTPHFEHKLFLSATPHNGYSESFSSLLELLDNQRFARSVRPNPEQLAAVMVRRLKRELPPRWDGTPRYPERIVEPLEVAYTDAERAAHRALSRYAELRAGTARDDMERFASEFVMKLLKKRLFSSPEAFRLTLEKHLESLRNARRPGGRTQMPVVGMLRRQVEALDEDPADDNQLDFATDEAVDSAVALFSPLSAEEEQLLAELRAWATDAARRLDSKAVELISWLKSTVLTDEPWNSERVIIFSEYRATQKWLQGMLAFNGFTGEDRVMTMYGGMRSDDRERVKAAFQTSPDISPVRILLATDSASEGIDLQNHCSRLIHYEIPWNPNRMEQRNGRIDRHGQRQPQVMIYHFVGKGYRQNAKNAAEHPPGDLEGDLEFLMRAVQKVENIREDLGKVGPVISAQVTDAMLGRRKHLNTEQAERDSEASHKLLRVERDLWAQLQKLHEQLNETKRELHLDPESIQSVVSVGLSLAGQPPLQEGSLDGIWPDPTGKRTKCPVFRLPHFAGSWGRVTEGLRHPHTQEVRPIVFDHTLASGRDDVVLAHLNHRLVQNCLQRLRAEIWSVAGHHRLHRITARVIPNKASDVPVVIAHGRLVVLGGDNKRLHEEIIFAGGELREGRFARISQVGRLEQLLNVATTQRVAESMQRRLMTLWPTHEGALLRSLDARMKDRTGTLQSRLDERAAREISAMRAVLDELRASIRSQLHDVTPQLELFSTPEKDQFERDRNALERRVDELPREMEQEEKLISARYAEPTPRLFPVSVTYLVPEALARQGGA